MFAKKFLSSSILSLFIGYHIMKASATGIALTVCNSDPTTVDVSGPANSVCYYGKKIYAILSDATKYQTSVDLDTGLNVLSIVSNVITKDTLGSAFTDKTQLALLYCDDSSCAQTYGYVKDNTNWIIVKSEADSADVSSNATNANCDASSDADVGLITAEGAFCLKSGLTATNTAGNYIMTAASSAGPIPNANSAITIATNAIVWNPKLDDEFCFTTASNLITVRDKNYCDNNTNACNDYYTCTDGICTKTTAIINERSGDEVCNLFTGANCQNADYGDYYFIGNANDLNAGTLSANLLATANSGSLYKCTVSEGPTSSCSLDSTTIGYLKNADIDHNSDGGIPYIECSATATTTSITVNGQAVTVAKNSCKAIAKPGVSTCSGNTGKLIYATTYKLCIDETSTPVEAGAANYLVDAHSISTFEAAGVQSGYSVVVEVDDAGNFIRRAQTGKKYIYALKTGKRVYNKGEDGYATAMCSAGTLKSDADEYILNKSATDYVDYYKVNTPAA